ncbi:hypothetical protein SAMN05443637_1018 [Pseudonocardia thermophila]|jgi:hypothetical protein|uniref:Uncharacterized protein n=1 Tax=Pseudonocardia thermophila TaxID=1848 RepID=A0A1M6N3P2_PSETH|nr:hypothetical protein [Pseudonocardia thermophila]SHJ90391.1 hypothetical protein SAMN05443637_1018 [Pseudonocardia thermophila]
MSANAPHLLAGPLPSTTEQPGYDLDHWLCDDGPDLRPLARVLAAVVTVLLAVVAVVIGR